MNTENKQAVQVVFGFHAVEAALSRNPGQVLEVRVDQVKSGQRMDNVRALAVKTGIPIRLRDRQELNQLARQGNRPGNHQGVVALIGRADSSPGGHTRRSPVQTD